MKNYNKIFADENKLRFDQQNRLKAEANKREKKIVLWTIIPTILSLFLLEYFDYGWTFLGFHWEWPANLPKSGDGNTIFITFVGSIVLIIIAIVVASVIIQRVNKSLREQINADKETLETEAKKFASSTYLDDLISALNTVFTLDASFKDNFKKIIVKFEWLDYNGFRHWGHDITYFYNDDGNKVWIEEKLVIRHEGSKYHLKEWNCENDSFRFFFEKINANGLVEKNVEFKLPVVE
jgi:hypothetical protein